MKYANDEARKLAEKGLNCACIEDKVVYGWAIHYFEEDCLESNLYNEDGTEYKDESKKSITPKVESKPTTKKPEKQQASLFDLMSFDTTQNEEKSKENAEKLSYKAQCSTYSQPDILEENEDYEESEQNNIEENKQQVVENKKITIQDYYKIYHEQELNYPDVVVLTKLGDFYEAFNENAERIAKVLGLVLTSRDVGLENKVAIAGFPVHIKEKYLEKLQKQYTILTIENDELKFYEKLNTQLESNEMKTIDKDYMKMLFVLLDGKLTLNKE